MHHRPHFWASPLALILSGPLVLAAGDSSSVRPRADDPRVAAQAAEYRRARNPVVDRLLPEGEGGTHFYESLGGPVGEAYLDAAAIGLTVGVVTAMWPESIELHERAHLVHAYLPRQVERLMARLPPGDEDPGQHFALMAERAWEVVAPPRRGTVNQTRRERLRDAEASVPGTAGFVAWYLRHISLPAEDAGRLADDASALLRPHVAEWKALWAALDARRRADGTFQPWAARAVPR